MAVNVSLSLVLGVLGFYIVRSWQRRARKRAPLPPGPKGLPLVGNVSDLPKAGELECLHWLKHKDLYGPISSVRVMGQTLIILNDSRLAYELMEKRSVLHSSRPKQIFAGEMLGWENTLGLSPYNDRFRAYRKKMAQVLGSSVAASQFNPLHEAEVGHFLLRMLEGPENLLDNIRKEAGAVILKLSYGYTIEPHESDPLVDLAGKAMDQFGRAASPGTWLVDMIPFLRYVPEWFPGAGFRRVARTGGLTLTELAERPYAFVKHQMKQHKYEQSFLSQLLEPGELDPGEDWVAKWSSMSLYTAGADTTVSSMACFFLAMTMFPEIQRKAQEEIDRVIGAGRLPGFQDRENLPYINAMVKEVLRWHPVAPMGLPHMTTEDDICEGYLIPKGAYLMPNIWYFTHDPEIYHEPMAFQPERFLADSGRDPEPGTHKLSFGFGRRICPGRLLADSSLYLNIVQTLTVFNIESGTKNAQKLDPGIMFLPGVVSHPAPFKASIKPRSSMHEVLIRSLERIYPWEESDANVLGSLSY